MTVVEVKNVVKTYGDNTVVDDVSFHVAGGEVPGLIGPNGAGKTAAIRMRMDLIHLDSGEVVVLGEGFSEAVKDCIGYLPEERGLYKKMHVIDTLTYLASLKGMGSRPALDGAIVHGSAGVLQRGLLMRPCRRKYNTSG